MGNATGGAEWSTGCRACRAGERETEVNGDDAPQISQSDDLNSLQLVAGGASSSSAPPALATSCEPPAKLWVLPPDGNLTVMMFGMTGAGKSALGNLIAGSNVFEAADDTASVTNLDSVMRYEAQDGSVVVMDTIGLGDTEIDQDKVVASIRDVALSAPMGIDVLLFVMRNTRITDDAIARLIYVTEYLWGSECLLNLYIVVTFASRYLKEKEEAVQWIERQAEINWRFKHIYGLVGNNPNRFIFVDNPDRESGEPNVEERQAMSQAAVMRTLALHPRDVIPPFTHAIMKCAHQMTEAEITELKLRQQEYRDLGRDDGTGSVVSTASPEEAQEPTDSTSAPASGSTEAPAEEPSGEAASSASPKRHRQHSSSKLSKKEKKDKVAKDLRDRRERARKRKEEAEQALRKRLAEIRMSPAFTQQVVQEAESATLRFHHAYSAVPESESSKQSANGSPVAACKRMLGSLARGMGRRFGKGSRPSVMGSTESGSRSPRSPRVHAEEERPAPPPSPSVDVAERALDGLVARLTAVLRGGIRETFERLAGPRNATLTPLKFQTFLAEVDPSISQLQAGGLWRRGDRNCDGQLDFLEFAALFGGSSVKA